MLQGYFLKKRLQTFDSPEIPPIAEKKVVTSLLPLLAPTPAHIPFDQACLTAPRTERLGSYWLIRFAGSPGNNPRKVVTTIPVENWIVVKWSSGGHRVQHCDVLGPYKVGSLPRMCHCRRCQLAMLLTQSNALLSVPTTNAKGLLWISF